MSIAFDDASQTIRVTGLPLQFGDKHFPAPTELIIGRAPRDVVLTRRRPSEQGWWSCTKAVLKGDPGCLLTHNFDLTEEHIDFNSKENEPRKMLWPTPYVNHKPSLWWLLKKRVNVNIEHCKKLPEFLNCLSYTALYVFLKLMFPYLTPIMSPDTGLGSIHSSKACCTFLKIYC